MWELLMGLFDLFKPSVVPSPRFADIDAVDHDDARLAAAGRAAIAEAKQMFDQDVIDPPHTEHPTEQQKRWLSVIASIITRAGWSFALPYTGNKTGATQWCGMFAASCWRAAGINPALLATWFASTIRLYCWARYQPWNGTKNPKPSGAPRLMMDLTKKKELTFEVRAGDIGVLGDGNPSAGDHIFLIESYDPVKQVFHTIEGNGGGLGPDGKHREGIVRGERSIKVVMFVYRPAPSDLVESLHI